MEVTQELLHELFEYRDGVLYWKAKRIGCTKGKPAGRISSSGYLQTSVFYKRYANHRLIFLMHYGYLPKFLDHVDENKLNNSIENLRPATINENNRNVGMKKNNTSGFKGVYWNKKSQKWIVNVKVNGKTRHFGCFLDKELAALVAIEARNKYHGEFANHGKQNEKVST